MKTCTMSSFVVSWVNNLSAGGRRERERRAFPEAGWAHPLHLEQAPSLPTVSSFCLSLLPLGFLLLKLFLLSAEKGAEQGLC